MKIAYGIVAALLANEANAQAACGPKGFRTAGSSTVYPVAVAWAQRYKDNCNFDLIVGTTVPVGYVHGDGKIAVEGGGSGAGATRACVSTAAAVDIGNMSREWKTSEATSADSWNYKCKISPEKPLIRVDVAIDGVTVVVKKSGVANSCLAVLKGLTTDQLRWIYSDLTVEQLVQSGWQRSALKNGKGPTTPLWSSLNKLCSDKEINISGPDDKSGTQEFFKEKIFKAPGEGFDKKGTRGYFNSADDTVISNYVKNDEAAIGYFGYAYYFNNMATLYASPIMNRQGTYIQPNKANILSNTYNPLTRRIYMNVLASSLPYTRPYLEFGYSPAGDTLVAGTGYDPVPAADQILMLSRLKSNKGIDITQIKCGSNGVLPIGVVNDVQENRFVIWTLLYTAKCPLVDPVISKVPDANNGLARTCGSAGPALHLAVIGAKVSYPTSGNAYTFKCPTGTRKLVEIEVAPNTFAYANDAAAPFAISKGLLQFVLSGVGTSLPLKINITPNNDAATNTEQLKRIPSAFVPCFAGKSTVEVMNKGIVQMKELSIGDMVKVAGGKYSEIYSFGHFKQDVKAEFMSIDAGFQNPLLISNIHMVFVEDKAISASSVKVGDRLNVVGGYAVVKRISSVTSSGAFAPFTKEGTIVVNSIVASSYVNLKGDSQLIVGGVTLDMHSVAHISQAPHRLVCGINADFCTSETYSDEGISAWVETPFTASVWLFNQNPIVMTFIFFPVLSFILLAAIIEGMVASQALLLIVVGTAIFFTRKTKKSA